jgi:ParB-like nuclease family protein
MRVTAGGAMEASAVLRRFPSCEQQYREGVVLFSSLLTADGEAAFEAASRRSFFLELSAIFTGRERVLLPLRDVVRAARMDGQVDRGVREIPLCRIRGSENRTADFDVAFHPLSRHLRERWTRLYALIQQGREMPPIDVYEVGELYFVRDGHHRVSIARRLGWDTIRAHVVEVRTRAPLDAEVDSRDLLGVAEYARFLERTHLDRVRPEARLECSNLGRYDVIYEHILGRRYFLSEEREQEASMAEAAASWYDSVYRPVMAVAERHQLADALPGWTETDIYLELTRLWLDLDQEGQPAGPDNAAAALLSDADAPRRGRQGRRRPRWRRLGRRGQGGGRAARRSPAR